LEPVTDGDGVRIRAAEPAGARAISSLITLLAKDFILPGSAAEEHQSSLSPSAVAECRGNGNYRYHGAVHENRIGRSITPRYGENTTLAGDGPPLLRSQSCLDHAYDRLLATGSQAGLKPCLFSQASLCSPNHSNHSL
jgi:hypothetical protein